MVRSSRIAQAEEFVTTLPDGYDAHIAQGGSNLSGGQKQRLSIARALVKDPSIYVFDDSFSALDMKTDATLREALYRETAGSTVLIVAQRVGTILTADQIIVLDNGEIVGCGKHRELLRSCEVYREIALSQLSEDELVQA
jgi:ATP-binding cassette subfamily B protein